MRPLGDYWRLNIGRSRFEADMVAHFGIADNPKKDAFLRIVWEMGHADGYYAVFNCADDLIVLIN